MVATVDDPELGATTQIGVPINLLGTPGGDHERSAARRRAQHRDLGRLGSTPTRSPPSRRGSRWRRASTPRCRDPLDARPSVHVRALAEPGDRGPLEGVTLVDFGQYLAGPFGPMIIGDLGADVIKVEPVTGDGMRLAGKPFFGCQRGKRDIAVNLKDPEGLEDRARARRARPTSSTTT